MAVVRDGLRRIVAEGQPMTVRQVFYQASNRGLIEKSQGEYKRTIGRLLAEMRLSSVGALGFVTDASDDRLLNVLRHRPLPEDDTFSFVINAIGGLLERVPAIPFSWIADNTRWMRKPRTFDSAEAALRRTAETYRRSVWDSQGAYVEVWIEKEALAGVVVEVTEEWDVPLMVTRGYASLSFLYSAAATIADQDKPTYIYYFGDYDPSGMDIPRNVEARLREFAPDSDITFERVAVTPEQIHRWQLPTRPTKTTDTRAASFTGDSVELDAIAPDDLRDLIRTVIEQHVDRPALEALRVAEASEREILSEIVATFGGAA